MRLKPFIIIATLIASSPIILIALWVGFAIIHAVILQVMGYDVDIPPDELAQQIYDEGDAVERCMNLRRAVPTMGPSLEDKQWNCVLEYAKISKNPKACELIMPSRYGLACVGYAKENDDPCFITSYGTVRGNGIETTLEECNKGPEAIKNNACCIIARITKQSNDNECNTISNTALRDQCQSHLAFKKTDTSYCDAVLSKNSRAACEVISKALRDDPTIIE